MRSSASPTTGCPSAPTSCPTNSRASTLLWPGRPSSMYDAQRFCTNCCTRRSHQLVKRSSPKTRGRPFAVTRGGALALPRDPADRERRPHAADSFSRLRRSFSRREACGILRASSSAQAAAPPAPPRLFGRVAPLLTSAENSLPHRPSGCTPSSPLNGTTCLHGKKT